MKLNNPILHLSYGIIFLAILSISITSHQAYADSLIGKGVNLKINGNLTSGVLTLKGQQYKAPNLATVTKGDQIKLTGYIDGAYHVLLMAIGVHTNGIEYKFNGVISNNGKNTPITFTALLTNEGKKQTTTTKSPITKTPAKQTPGIPMLMLTSKSDRVYMAYPYNFVVKIFDPMSNPQKIFDQFFGGISDVNIVATILDPNNKIIGQSTGKTDSKGTYQDGITMPYTEYSQEQLQVMVNATKKGYATQLATLPLLLIHPQGGSAPVCSVSTNSLPNGGVNGTAYTQTLSSSNCQSPVWSIQSGSLPASLVLVPSSGVISGTIASHNGLYSFVVKVTSSDGRVATTSLSISIP